MELVEVEQPERMNLLGHILASVLRRKLADPRAARKAAALYGEVAVVAGVRRMAVTIRFAEGRATLRRGLPHRARARIEGELGALIGVASAGSGVLAGLGASAGNLLSRRLRVSGDPRMLGRLLPLLRV